MKLSVNILCLDCYDTLIDSLTILKEDLKKTDHEIIVIDNGSKDNLRYQESDEYNHIKIFRNENNLGISKGKNQGIQKSEGDFIFLLDGDIVPVRNSVLMLLDYVENNKDCEAIGFLPNKFSMNKNKNHEVYHEDYCHTLFNPRVTNTACLYYGIFRKSVFDRVMLCEDGEFGQPGYGWEDHDFYEQMKHAGITQWLVGLNHESGKYYHKINSSIRSMGYSFYMSKYDKRKQLFLDRWENKCLTK